jgi:hypothetical protein
MIIGTMKLPGLLALIKPAGDPLVNIAGAYFPAWLACMFVGVIGSWGISVLAARTGFGRALRPAPVILPCLFVSLTCGMWLLFFSAR